MDTHVNCSLVPQQSTRPHSGRQLPQVVHRSDNQLVPQHGKPSFLSDHPGPVLVSMVTEAWIEMPERPMVMYVVSDLDNCCSLLLLFLLLLLLLLMLLLSFICRCCEEDLVVLLRPWCQQDEALWLVDHRRLLVAV